MLVVNDEKMWDVETNRFLLVWHWRRAIIYVFNPFNLKLGRHHNLRGLNAFGCSPHFLNGRFGLPLVASTLHVLICQIHLAHPWPYLTLQCHHVSRYENVVWSVVFVIGWEESRINGKVYGVFFPLILYRSARLGSLDSSLGLLLSHLVY